MIKYGMKILFYQTTCPHPYTVHSLQDTAVGGTESSMMRVAHALAKKHTVYIANQHIQMNEEIEGVHYITLDTAHQLKGLDHAILLQHLRGAPDFIKRFPGIKSYLWLHNMPSKRLYQYKKLFLKSGMSLIGVSQFHAKRIKKRVEAGLWNKMCVRFLNRPTVPVHCIYNSIAAEFVPQGIPVNPNKIISMSAPTKGLGITLAIFQKIRKHFPAMELYVARPWISEVGTLPEGVTFLGALPQAELRRHVAESLCVFYPQWQRMETFGLVYAEANALGTPFIANDFGAAPEVLSNPCQLIDGRDEALIIKTLQAWQMTRPTVWLKNEFQLEQVMHSWEKLFNSN